MNLITVTQPISFYRDCTDITGYSTKNIIVDLTDYTPFTGTNNILLVTASIFSMQLEVLETQGFPLSSFGYGVETCMMPSSTSPYNNTLVKVTAWIRYMGDINSGYLPFNSPDLVVNIMAFYE